MKIFDITERKGKSNQEKEYRQYVLTNMNRENIGYDK